MAGLPGLGDYIVQNANLNLGVQNAGFTITAIDVEPLPDGVIPNHGQIAAEDRRRRTLINKVPHMDDFDAAERELRYHQVLTRANAMAPLHPGLVQMLQTIQESQNLANQRMETLIQLMSARSRNQYIRAHELDEPFAGLPKLFPGHPFAQPPPVQGVNITVGSYPVGSMPPQGLLPANRDGFEEMKTLTLPNLRRKLSAIYWFYHDERLAFPDPNNATKRRCRLGVTNLERFLLP
ncbi:Mn-containing catalase [Striga asiatica]|uniref:Mn-containing catalase n=1 Tax=Striga asiatica TaxID=4170 RepID=A0A5A7RFK9_STRAF|nr:Mn-containing catalase [Striga asiatica]